MSMSAVQTRQRAAWFFRSVQCRQPRVTFRALQSFSALTYGCEYGTAIEHRVQIVPFRLRVGFVGDERFVFPDEDLGFRQRRRIVVGESFAHHLQTSKRPDNFIVYLIRFRVKISIEHHFF